jgi:hypothetical protein
MQGNMDHQRNQVKIMWSVWDGNPDIFWHWAGRNVKITLRLPPISVVALPSYGIIAITGNAEEFGGNNLIFYTFEGNLLRTYSAPPHLKNAQFSGVSETNDEVVAIVAYETDDGCWIEEAGKLNLETGFLTDLHRSY